LTPRKSHLRIIRSRETAHSLFSRTFFGLAMKVCVELGLHRQKRSSKVCLKSERNKRLFWICYWHERELAIAMGRPPSISDHDIDVEVRDCRKAQEFRLKPDTAPFGCGRRYPRSRCLAKRFRAEPKRPSLPTNYVVDFEPPLEVEENRVSHSTYSLSRG
jgi:hypothetical protein